MSSLYIFTKYGASAKKGRGCGRRETGASERWALIQIGIRHDWFKSLGVTWTWQSEYALFVVFRTACKMVSARLIWQLRIHPLLPDDFVGLFGIVWFDRNFLSRFIYHGIPNREESQTIENHVRHRLQSRLSHNYRIKQHDAPDADDDDREKKKKWVEGDRYRDSGFDSLRKIIIEVKWITITYYLDSFNTLNTHYVTKTPVQQISHRSQFTWPVRASGSSPLTNWPAFSPI